MNEKVTQALQKAKEVVIPIYVKSRTLALQGYAKGNELMDRVELLKSKTNKLIAWCALGGITVLIVGLLVFSGGDGPENAFRCYARAIEEKDWIKMQDSISDGNPTNAGRPMTRKEMEEFATSEFCKGQMQSQAMEDLGKCMRDADIVSIKRKGDRAVVRFRPTDKVSLREMKEEKVLGFRIDAVKTDDGWKIDSGSFDTITRK